MNVKFIGTGAMWTKYNSASYLINDSIILDIPNGTCKELRRLNILPNNINNVVITHFHGDHYFDIPFYILSKNKAEDNKINIYCDKTGKRKIRKIFKLAFPQDIEKTKRQTNLKYITDDTFKIDGIKFKRIEVDHGRFKPAYGYLIEKDNIIVGFTGDTCYCKNVEYMASKSKYLICDCSNIEGNHKHMGINNIEMLANKYKDCTFIVTHMIDVTREKIKQTKIENIIVPDDGYILDIK